MKPGKSVDVREEIVEVHSAARSPSPKHKTKSRSRSRSGSRKLSNGHIEPPEVIETPAEEQQTTEKSKRDSWIKSEHESLDIELPIHDQIKQGILGFVEKEIKKSDKNPSFAWSNCAYACHGVLGGVSLMHLLLISYSDSLDAGHLSFHAVVTMPYVATYFFLCVLCLISVLDRNPKRPTMPYKAATKIMVTFKTPGQPRKCFGFAISFSIGITTLMPSIAKMAVLEMKWDALADGPQPGRHNQHGRDETSLVLDRYYPRYHLAPPYGWMNDPNGFCFFNNEYHLFYQYNPNSSLAPGTAHWGHAKSTDLYHWEQLPIALYPDQWYDKNGVFSGSALVENATMYIFYTSNLNHPDETPAFEEHQILATSTDGVNVQPLEETARARGRIQHTGRDAHGREYTLKDKAGEVNVLAEKSNDLKLYIESESAKVSITYDAANGQVILDRGGTDGVRRTEWKPEVTLKWQIFIDASSIELFCGEVSRSQRYAVSTIAGIRSPRVEKNMAPTKPITSSKLGKAVAMPTQIGINKIRKMTTHILNSTQSVIQEYYDYYLWTLSLSDGRTKGWPLVDSPLPTVVYTALYLFIVWLGPKLMKNRQPFQLTWLLVPYNLAMAGLNAFIAVRLLTASFRLRYSYICEPCRQKYDSDELQIADAVWWYYFSKLLEFCDTFFFILRKKDEQLTFLHVYHHSTMFSFWWIGIKWIQFTCALVLGINGIRMGCEFPLWMHYVLIFYMISFIVLFGNFYMKAYLAKGSKCMEVRLTMTEMRPPARKGHPVMVEFSIYVVDVNSINVEDMDFRVDMFIRQTWSESRLQLPEDIFEEGDDHVTLPPEFFDNLWHPDPYFLNSKVTEIAELTHKFSSVTLYRNQTVRYAARMHAIIACQMEFQLYPMDIQFERQIGHHLIQTFAPSSLVVMLSWFSFWLDLDAIPGRVTLLVTCMLTLVTMFTGLRADIPPVAYVKALDLWMAGCMMFVFAALGEFVVVKVLDKHTVIFAMEGIGVVMPVENEMAKPQQFLGCPGVLNVAMTIVISLYGTVGFFGYIKYGDDVRGSVTLNLPQDEILAQTAKILMALAILFTYSLQFYVPMEMIWRQIHDKISVRYHEITQISIRTIAVVSSGDEVANINIYFAEYNINTISDCVGGTCIETVMMHPDKIIVHEDFGYKLDGLFNDIALMRLRESTPYTGDDVTKFVRGVEETLSGVSEEYGGPKWSVTAFCGLTLVVLVPLCQINKLKYLVPFSAIANFVWVGAIGISIYYCVRDPPKVTERNLATSITGIPNFISTSLFAMEGIGVVMPIENEMIKPAQFLGCPGVLNIAMVTVSLLYACVGFAGYLQYGDEVRGSLTLNLPQDEILAQSAKIMVACVMLLTFALIFYVPFDVVWRHLKHRVPARNHGWAVAGIRLVGTLLIVGIATAVPRLELFMELIGAILLSVMGLMLPAITETVFRWGKDLGPVYCVVFKNTIIVLFSLIAMVSGVVYSLKTMLEKL
ncbi:hypothetical protein MSG28_001378 [Choristoneura fumiferana]|uniref:Uncharacterized protein n=1 Tax=Choristoneura fumiferana TaxID=7141 RepID=A0ACC0KUE9_CHOFU|nr:hypothetical protein MSG28_001378 [Choristoneura fumiferana]